MDTMIEKPNPELGDNIICDEWRQHYPLIEGDKIDDFECQFRVPMFNGNFKVAVNVKVTGRKPREVYRYHDGTMVEKWRILVEFVGDGEVSTYSGGWLFKKY